MTDQSEKRFHSIMDKLFHAPKTKNNTSSSELQSQRNKKRRNPESTASISESRFGGYAMGGFKKSLAPAGPSQTPMCRPWDRGDLTKRLATFKSMTWFGKPKVVSAVNCARRGWINVEMDIIACEACGARLLFSTPSSWTQQQVEKAAAVFSLKLDSGHKLLCPWIDNACDETLAQFPPTPAPALVDAYKERSSALLRLSALPIISCLAIDYMRSPQLEHFLKQSMLEYGPGSGETSANQYMGNECEIDSSTLYYQAQKLISLCGWEPRSLPYAVDCKDQVTQSSKDMNPSESSERVPKGKGHAVILYPTSGSDEITEVDEDQQDLDEYQSDPDSFVVDCRLCGASVGLWAFSTVPRPLELFRLVGPTEVNGQTDSAPGAPITLDSDKENHFSNSEGISDAGGNNATMLNLKLTIAGGPPPTKQNFRATVSLPIISRYLRTGFSSNFSIRDHTESCMNQENIQLDLRDNNLHQQEKDETEITLPKQIIQPEDILKSHENDNELYICENDLSLFLNEDSVEVVDTVRNQNSDLKAGNFDSETGIAICSQFEESLISIPDSIGTTGNGENSENKSLSHQEEELLGTVMIHSELTSQGSHHEASWGGSCLEADENVAGAREVESSRANQGSDFQNYLGEQVNKQNIEGVKDKIQSSVISEVGTAHRSGNDLKQSQSDQAMKFDPIRQHRHFCPWVASTGNAPPGWLQTLSALNRTTGSSLLLPSDSSSPSKIEVDDPVASIRKLFASPLSAKRKKLTHGPS